MEAKVEPNRVWASTRDGSRHRLLIPDGSTAVGYAELLLKNTPPNGRRWLEVEFTNPSPGHHSWILLDDIFQIRVCSTTATRKRHAPDVCIPSARALVR